MRKRLAALVLVLGLCAGMVGCDRATKQLATDELRGRGEVTLVPGVLDLRYVENRGIGFNLERFVPEAIRKPVVYAPPLIAMPLLLLFSLRRRISMTERLAGTLFLAGAAGNAIDRYSRGYVVDFIHIHYWPIFNVADLCLVTGACLIIYASFRPGGGGRTRAAPS